MTWIEQLQQNGIRRVGSPKSGFRYHMAAGRPVRPPDLERIRSLKIPPAWTHVAINRFPHGRLQAIGKDKAGRWQYQYHPAFVRQQEERKYQRLISFARALPKLRRAVGRGLKCPASSREAVMSCILRVL